MIVWCGEKEECRCVVIHSIPGVLMCSVCELLLEWRERMVVLEESGWGKRRKSGKPKTQIQLQL